MSTDASRRFSAILASLRFGSWDELANWLHVSREHLLAVRGGRIGVGYKLAGMLAGVLYVRARWILEGELPVFFPGVEPDPDGAVERTILGQVGRGGFVGSGVTVYRSLDAVEDGPREFPASLPAPQDLPPQMILGAGEPVPFTWLANEVRPAGLPAAVAREALFLRLDRQSAPIVGGSEGDTVLFLRAKAFFESSTPGIGDHLIGMVASGRGKKGLWRMRVAESEPPRAQKTRQGARTKAARHITVTKGVGTYCLAPESPPALPRRARLYAAALRLERDLAGCPGPIEGPSPRRRW